MDIINITRGLKIMIEKEDEELIRKVAQMSKKQVRCGNLILLTKIFDQLIDLNKSIEELIKTVKKNE